MLSIAEWTDKASALSSQMKLTSSASFSPSIRISLRLKTYVKARKISVRIFLLCYNKNDKDKLCSFLRNSQRR